MEQKHDSRSSQVPIPDHIKEDLESLSQTCKNATLFTQRINEKFCRVSNPYYYLLDLVYYGQEHRKNYFPDIASLILLQFSAWIKQNPHVSDHLSVEVKTRSLDFILTHYNNSFIEKVCRIFKFEGDVLTSKTVIDKHLKLGKYKQVCLIVKALNMQSLYPLDQIIFPLICQNNMNLVQKYFEDQPELQIQFAIEVDSFCKSENHLDNFVRLAQSSPKNHDLKWLRKILSNFLKHFDVPVEYCPNLIQTRSYGAMNYLFHKCFIEGGMSNDSFKEMIATVVVSMPSIVQEIIAKLVHYNELDLAIEMAEEYQIPRKSWPESLLTHLEQKSSEKEESEKQGENVDTTNYNFPSRFLEFRLSESDIVHIDDLEKFMFCVDEISMSYDVIGFDAEWRPSLGTCSESISLLQIATWDNVYLFDMLALLKILEQEHWCNLLTKVFFNSSILKLGYGIWGDISMMIKAIKNITFEKSHYSCVVDMAIFFPQLCSFSPSFDNYVTEQNVISDDNRGLSKLCQQLLGKPLEKLEQCSDWNCRPLRRAQIVYAALDAYCLLQIYEQLHHVLRNVGLDVQKVLDEFLKNNLHKPKAAKSGKKEDVKPQIPHVIDYPRTPISKFKVLVDNCLSGLGKQLRMRGADVLIVDDGLSVSDLIKTAQEEQRFILSAGSRFTKLAGYFSPEMCLSVPHQDTTSVQASFVCKHFNIVCTESDIFSRCTLCNCDRYLQVSSEDMQLLWAIRCSSPNLTNNAERIMEPFIICDNGYITEDGIMDSGVELQMVGLSSEILLRGLMFFVCTSCGKVYWEGSHHKRTKKILSQWISDSDQDPSDTKDAQTPSNSQQSKVKELFACTINESLDSQFTDTSSTKSPLSDESTGPIYYVDTLSDEEEDDTNDIMFQ